MTTQTITIRRYWYLAFQDGPMDNIEYETEEAAKKALKRLRKVDKFTSMGVCIMSREHRV